jgi:hypothetical protein
MKRTAAFAIFILLTMTHGGKVSAEEHIEEYIEQKNQLVFVFSEGTSASWLTRIIKQTDRSNFVFRDFMPGLYFRTDIVNIKYINPMIRLSAYYPLSSTFNHVPQMSKTPLHFGFDLNTGLSFNLFDLNYVRLNAGPALHLFYMTSDRWNYFNLGGTALLGMEVPLTERWTVLLNGMASLDNGNFGTNRHMEPFDIAFQYQVDIGVRYSKKTSNKTFLFRNKTDDPLESSFYMR